MKKFINLAICFIVVTVMLTNCSKEDKQSTASNKNVLKTEQKFANQAAQDKWRQLEERLNTAVGERRTTISAQAIQSAAITYKGRLCSQTRVSGTATPNSINNSTLWEYYSFQGRAGDVITIHAPRTGNCAMDPALSLFFGTTADASEVYPWSGGANMTFLAFADDNISQSCSQSSCYADPLLREFVLPYTGTYTVAVFDFASCGTTPLTYNLTITGVAACNVVIGGCDSGVPDRLLPSGRYMSEEIAACAANARNHGSFVSCVTQLTNDWKKAGLITGEEKGKMTSCAAKATLP